MKRFAIITSLVVLASCSQRPDIDLFVDELPPLVCPLAGTVVPANIVPLNYWFADSLGVSSINVRFAADDDTVFAAGNNGDALPTTSMWRTMLADHDSLQVTVRACMAGKWLEYKPFTIFVGEPVDPYLVYRKIEPGYETWNEMGIYERNLESFVENGVITNRRNDYGCINCHTFCQANPDRMLLHMRVGKDGTYYRSGNKLVRSAATPPKPFGTFVYPSWHAGGRYVAFSNNTTKQMFHTSNLNRIEVMDFASNVVVVDTETDRVISSPLLSSPQRFETFPCFSPDGRKLFFCTADSVPMPLGYEGVRYSLCSIDFDAEQGVFGCQVDTLYNAHTQGGSVSFPRPSPCGRWLVFTRSDYGNFSIWHRESDLYLLDLEDSSVMNLSASNSSDVESYLSWSSNGRWLVFSSRRLDGLYTRPFISYIDTLGVAHTPFIMPQKNARYYNSQMKSYNVPEFSQKKIGTLRIAE